MSAEELEVQLATLRAERAKSSEAVVQEALDAKIASLQAELDRLRSVEEEPIADGDTPRDLSPEERRAFDAGVARLRLWINRAEWSSVEKEVAALRSEFGERGELLEAEGDALLARKRPEGAREKFALALALRPGDVGLERKHAETVFSVARLGSLEDQLRGGELLDTDPMARAGAATFLSLLFPGVGQIVLGEQAKGIAMFAIWASAMTYMAINAIEVRGFLAQVGLARGGREPGGMFYLALSVAVLTMVVAVFDCAARTKTTPKRQIARPTPPVNLPFD